MGPIIHTLPFATQLSSSSMYAYTYTPIYVCIYTCVEKREDGAHSDWSRPRGARRGSLTFAKRRARALHSLAAHIYAACTRVYICMQPESERAILPRAFSGKKSARAALAIAARSRITQSEAPPRLYSTRRRVEKKRLVPPCSLMGASEHLLLSRRCTLYMHPRVRRPMERALFRRPSA